MRGRQRYDLMRLPAMLRHTGSTKEWALRKEDPRTGLREMQDGWISICMNILSIKIKEVEKWQF